MNQRFVCVINRNRDNFQVPLALENAGLLEAFVTDFYAPDNAPRWLPKFLACRRIDGLPHAKTITSRLTFFLQYGAQVLRLPLSRIVRTSDGLLARKARIVAARRKSALYCYHDYVPLDRSFKQPLVIFVFHPLAQADIGMLAADAERYPEASASFALESIAARHEEVTEAWSQASAFVCASTFTKASLLASGIASESITVIPYGLPEAKRPADLLQTRGASCQFLFVGQGIQRKGLHHLIRAWQARPRGTSRLTLVSYQIDPAIAALITDPSIILLGYQSKSELERLMREADVFAMPSLIEGFGLVYLEALAHGCHVIGTANTGLPDLELDDEALTLVSPGDIDGLDAQLTRAEARWQRGAFDQAAIAAQAARWTEAHFRKKIAAHAAATLAEFQSTTAKRDAGG